jgi:hypothetical protein
MAKKKAKSRKKKRVYGFNVSKPSEPLFTSQAAWKAQMTGDGAKKYLTDHLRAQLTREVPLVIEGFMQANQSTPYQAGFYAVARLIFPAISFMGCLYKGSDTTRHSIQFLEKFADPKYRKLAPVIFVMYRHGLIHTAMPKIIERDDKRAIGWHLTLDNPVGHLTIEKHPKVWNIVISLKDLYEDILKSLDTYILEFDGLKKNATLNRFKCGYLKMAAIEPVEAEPSKQVKAKLKASLNSIK